MPNVVITLVFSGGAREKVRIKNTTVAQIKLKLEEAMAAGEFVQADGRLINPANIAVVKDGVEQ